MGQRLIRADPPEVKQLMAREYLAAPVVSAEQGEIRLAPHQVDAASRLLAILGDHGGAVLADATGLGKTFVAIAVARLMPPAVVVAPAALRKMWQVSLGRAGVTARVESYESLSRGAPRRAGRPALLILDEAHHARNPRAHRYAALADLAWGASVLLLSATPIHNRGRDLRSLIALFMGSRADAMSEEDLRQLIVRRTAGSEDTGFSLPALGEPRWLTVPSDHETLGDILALPPEVPAAGGAPAHALLVLGLIRAWTSSEAALRAMLRRRLRRAASLASALECGRLPDRRELDSCPVVDEAVQLGFPELHGGGDAQIDVPHIREMLERHTEGVRRILASLDRNQGATDTARVQRLESIRQVPAPVVAFTQLADTATAVFRASAPLGGVAMVTGRGARIAAGRVTVDEIVQGFDTAGRRAPDAMPLDLLIATDVLSEGLSLRRAGTIVHLDLPWTVARLEQRVGRLRRPGSLHARVAVYAIGPPVEARELVPIVRALQRKARLASAVTGAEAFPSSLPLLGERLTRATAAIVRRGSSLVTEELRRTLASWTRRAECDVPNHSDANASRFSALALVGRGSVPRLLAVDDRGASDRPADLLQAVRTLSPRPCDIALSGGAEVPDEVCRAEAAVRRWLRAQRARRLAGPAIDCPSAAHAAMLKALQVTLARATRSQRGVLARRIEQCRQLVNSTRGIGAEYALRRLLDRDPDPDLDTLQQLLAARSQRRDTPDGTTRIVAILCSRPGQSGVMAFRVQSDELDCG